MSHNLPFAIIKLAIFLANHRDGLFHAVELLGGPIAGRRLLRLLEAFSPVPPVLTRWIGRELVVLHRLLSLHDVADFDNPSAHYFALIEPTDPAVEEICLLTDQLTDCMAQLVADQMIDETDLDQAA